VDDRELLVAIRNQVDGHLEEHPLSGSGYVMHPSSAATKTPKGFFSGWVWPVPIWDGEHPVISDGFNRYAIGRQGEKDYQRQHLGVDIMFRNSEARAPNLPEWSKWYHMPSSTVPMLAAGPGHIWFAGKTGTGWTIKIDHHGWVGFPLLSYYTHMSELFVDDWDGTSGLYVPAGFDLGLVGNSPLGADPNHCHFELLDYTDGIEPGRENRALDPEPYLKCFGYRSFPR
jgi:hypothetical protein